MFICTLVSCAERNIENINIPINKIEIISQGNSLEDSDDMREVCKQFHLTKKQVLHYYLESRASTESEIHDSYNILPCNSTGIISINGEAFSWIIRAGGVGSFYNKQKTILRVCDKKCCKLTKGIC